MKREAIWVLCALAVLAIIAMAAQTALTGFGRARASNAMPVSEGYFNRAEALLLKDDAHFPFTYDCVIGSLRFDQSQATREQRQFFWRSFLPSDINGSAQPLLEVFRVIWKPGPRGEPCRPIALDRTLHRAERLAPPPPEWRGRVIIPDRHPEALGLLRDTVYEWEATLLPATNAMARPVPAFLGEPLEHAAGSRLLLVARDVAMDRGACYVSSTSAGSLLVEVLARAGENPTYAVKVNGMTLHAGATASLAPGGLLAIQEATSGRIHALTWQPSQTPGHRALSEVQSINEAPVRRRIGNWSPADQLVSDVAAQVASGVETLLSGGPAAPGDPRRTRDVELSLRPALQASLQRRLTRFIRLIDRIDTPRPSNSVPEFDELMAEVGRKTVVLPIRAGATVIDLRGGDILAMPSYPDRSELESFTAAARRRAAGDPARLQVADQNAAQLREGEAYWTRNANLLRHRIGSVNKIFLSAAVAVDPRPGERDLRSLLNLRLPCHDWSHLDDGRENGGRLILPGTLQHWVLGRVAGFYRRCEHATCPPATPGLRLGLEEAIRGSCNQYFATMGHLLLAEWSGRAPRLDVNRVFPARDAVAVGSTLVAHPIVPGFGERARASTVDWS